MATDNRRSMDAFENAMKRVLVDTGENFGEEKLEPILGQFDLSYLLTQPSLAGTLARLIDATPADARLLFINFLAAALDEHKEINPILRFVVVTFLRALPSAIPLMFRKDVALNVASLEQKIAQQQKIVGESIRVRQAYVGNKRTDLIHDQAIDPAPGDAKDLNRGDLLTILERFDRNPLCPDCFHKELASGRIRIERVEKKGVPKPLHGINNIKDLAKRRFLVQGHQIASREEEGDPGFGLEGRGWKLAAAIEHVLLTEPEQLETLIPNNPPDLSIWANMTQIKADAIRRNGGEVRQLPEVFEEFMEALFIAYNTEHPLPAAYVAGRDMLDGWYRWLPKDMRPKSRGWAGIKEIYTKFSETWLGWALIHFGLLILFLLIGMIVVGALSLVGGIISVVAGALFAFGGYFSWVALMIELGIIGIWVGRLFLIPTDGPGKVFFRMRNSERMTPDGLKTTETIKVKAPEPMRARLLVLGLASALVGVFITPMLYSLGHITHLGVMLMTMAVMALLATIEIVNKFGDYTTFEDRQLGVRRMLNTALVIFVTTVVLSLLASLFVPVGIASEVSVLGRGVAQKSVEKMGEVANVPVNQKQATCFQDRALYEAQVIAAGGQPGYCERNQIKYPCKCDSTF